MPRVLRNKSESNTEVTILGQKISFPICIAPTAFLRVAHPDGEIAVAKGLHVCDVVTVLDDMA